MGQDIWTTVVVGVKYDIIHTEKKIITTVKEYNPKTGEPFERQAYKWVHCVNGIDYDKEEYSKFQHELNKEGLDLWWTDSSGAEILIGMRVAGNSSDMYVEIDLERVQEAIVKVQPLLAKYGIAPEQVKLYSLAVWSY